MILKTPFRLIACGPSGCGKTQLVKNLVLNQRFDKPVHELVYCYSKFANDEALFDEIRKKLSYIRCSFIEGFPNKELDENTLFTTDDKHKLLIIDDLWDECLKTETIDKLFTCYSRHLNISVVVACQNLYKTQSKHSITTLLRNINYLILFVCRQNLPTVKMISSNFFVGDGYRLTEPFKRYVKQQHANDYFVIDFTCREPKLSVIYLGLSDSDPLGTVFKFANE